MNDRIIRLGFYAAGLVNIVGILTITRVMTSDTLALADPPVFSDFGIVIIILWGMAYIGTARYATSSILLPLTFALEKLAYTVNWCIWMTAHSHEVAGIMARDFLGGFFMGGYGVNDGLFCLFFAAVAYLNWRRPATQQAARESS